MYTNKDLNDAVTQGTFTQEAVDKFKSDVAARKESAQEDNENFRLVGGFNDIFVVIACVLLLSSSLWVVDLQSKALSYVIFSVIAWGLAEFFVRKRKMALPAIVLLLSFVSGVYFASMHFFSYLSFNQASMISACLAGALTYGHWLRFRVPITIAAATGGFIIYVVVKLLLNYQVAQDFILALLFACGFVAFALAMFWDARDRRRVTHKSDVAFWLHLLSAPLIIHPVFTGLGISQGNESLTSMLIIVSLYVLMTLISLIVDRRAFMVSSLVYVIYAIFDVLKVYGDVSYDLALTGFIIGAALLLLSALWQKARAGVVARLPEQVKNYVPVIPNS
ncbi:hypothetical protein TW85_05745 [Marinomonas sp. S3726]|uniref:hypothetical protein n=1 Tax=Marinomonas sp. S3726 TaxID=579484 RepID=UPI0005FA0B7A|nr:hypothetical protein [Marinomonas sp. S3726]KJZ15112.1 hypothetical protein TW85_05745 [Marinomonas sp. S3726]